MLYKSNSYELRCRRTSNWEMMNEPNKVELLLAAHLNLASIAFSSRTLAGERTHIDFLFSAHVTNVGSTDLDIRTLSNLMGYCNFQNFQFRSKTNIARKAVFLFFCHYSLLLLHAMLQHFLNIFSLSYF